MRPNRAGTRKLNTVAPQVYFSKKPSTDDGDRGRAMGLSAGDGLFNLEPDGGESGKKMQ
jgi:hypothetical protein